MVNVRVAQNKVQLSPATDRRYLVWLTLITLLAFGARVIDLGRDSFWFDELWTLNATRDDVATIVGGQDLNNPPGYFLVAYGAVQAVGVSEYALRFPSALAGTLTIPLIYVAACILAGRRVGVWAALLLAISPFHLRYSQEARGYALQVMCSMFSTTSLLLALVRQKRSFWLLFGLATALNAYTQFTAFVVLGCQLAFASLYGLIEWLRKTWSTRRLIASAAGGAVGLLVAAVIYGPYLSAAWAGVSANLGAGAWAGDWSDVTIFDRLGTAYRAFGFLDGTLAAVMGLLALLGVLYAGRQRQHEQVIWLLISCLLPFVVIAVSGVSRAPLAKNVLFVLPAYLLAAALGLEAIVTDAQRLMSHRPRLRRALPMAATGLVLAVGAVAVPIEHAHTEEDWRSIATYVQRVSQATPVIVPLTLDLPDGFNQGYEGLRHYLPQHLTEYHLLQGEHLTDPQVADLAGAEQSNGELWVVVLKRDVPLALPAAEFEIVPFQGGTYLVRPRQTAAPLESLVAAYPRLIEQARTPCYLWLDLAQVYMELNQYDAAHAARLNFSTPCPNSIGIRQALDRQLLAYYAETQQPVQVGAIAQRLSTMDAKDPVALQALSIYDLRAMFEAGTIANADPSPAKPIEVQRWVMPHNGDWGEALIMQTPARLMFRLQLPPEPVHLVSRVAMAPDSWHWGGDGARFSVTIQVESDQPARVYDRYVSNEQPDQTWHAVDVSLAKYAGQSITLTLETDPGPNGDTTGDWAGWDVPRIMYELAGTP
ncbi:MAG: glycosyltransferase family 39 protein [Chloroflexi bacterium]|nr:glycosyltransferase family 39 protein [Chloroflexota bacterium]